MKIFFCTNSEVVCTIIDWFDMGVHHMGSTLFRKKKLLIET